MAIASPTARALRAHVRPDEDNWFIEPVVADWWQAYIDGGNLEKEFAIKGSRIRASWAGSCAKSIAYHLAGVEISNPPTVANAWTFNLGTMIHDHVQAQIEKRYPGARSEVKVGIGEHGSGHMDMWVTRPDGRTVSVEIKSINGTGFRRMLDAQKPEGVRVKYVLQGALNAAHHDPQPDELLIAVFSLECMSPTVATKNGISTEYRRFAAQWSFSKEEYIAIAQDELRRLERVVELTDKHGPAAVPRVIPDPALPLHLVTNPSKGILTTTDSNGNVNGTGYTWHCAYCPFQDFCDNDSRNVTP